jgi:CNT family concentrative nucleoside transporter
MRYAYTRRHWARDSSSDFILAFQALPFIIVFASLMSLLYYWGIMQRLVKGFAVIFSHALGTSGAESLCTASNIFVGVESATAIRPYLSRMTDSELFTILAAGMSTVASSMMAVYATILHNDFPLIAGHLFSASIISAPTTFTIAGIFYWGQNGIIR